MTGEVRLGIRMPPIEEPISGLLVRWPSPSAALNLVATLAAEGDNAAYDTYLDRCRPFGRKSGTPMP
jgi:hypothetical protein